MNARTMLVTALACTLAAACNGGDGKGNEAGGNAAAASGEAGERRTLADGLAQAGGHSAFLQSAERAGMTELLSGTGPYTVFAPTDAAFQALPAEARAQLGEGGDRQRLVGLLSYHIVPGTVTAEDLARAIERGQGGRAELATHSGDNLTLSRDGEAIVVTDAAGGRARIVAADRIHSNGVVHAIDAVLMPRN